MAARAIWKGVILLGEQSVPVKLYSALSDRSVHFRLLHRKDRVPVKQVLVSPKTGKIVPFDQVKKAYTTEDRRRVMLQAEDLEGLQPEKSRAIEISRFVNASSVDYRWYARPYLLGPDGDDNRYFALITALDKSQKIGVAHWTMRNKEYHGALTLVGDYPALVAMRTTEQVVPLSALEAPGGEPLSPNELLMARQLINLLDSKYEPQQFHDEYRERVLELIAAKHEGRKVKQSRARPRRAEPDLNQALQASLKRARS